MASLRTLPGTKNLIACFTDATGRRLQRSTGTHVRKEAQRIAEQYEEVARRMKTEAQVRRVLSELFERTNGSVLPSARAETYLENWLTRKTKESARATAVKYQGVIRSFVEHLGDRAKLELGYLTSTDVLGYRDGTLARLSAATVNGHLKILRTAFESARRDGLVTVNPASQIETIKRRPDEGGSGRRAFTLDELRRILDVAADEWRGLVLFGVYTGQRLGDLARLCWQNIDLERREVRFVTRKTGRQIILPLEGPLFAHVSEWRSSDDPRQPLFPKAADHLKGSGNVGRLSNQFYDILVDAGLAPVRTHQSTGKGRSGKRQTSEISFHALRHTATSLLKNAGVSDAVAREFIGHDSPAVSKHYTHIEQSTLREAAAKMPDLFKAHI